MTTADIRPWPQDEGPAVFGSPITALAKSGARHTGEVLARARSVVTALAQPAALAGSIAAGYALVRASDPPATVPLLRPAIVLFIAIELSMAALEARAQAARRLTGSFLFDLRITGTAIALGTAITVVLAPLLRPTGPALPLEGTIIFAALPAVLALPIVRRFRMRVGPDSEERLLIVGSGVVAESMARRLSLKRGVTLVGFVDDHAADGSVLGPLASLDELCDRYRVTRVVVAFSRTPTHDSLDLLRRLHPRIHISVVPRMFELVNWSAGVEDFAGMPLLHVSRPRLGAGSRAAKRTVDIAVAVGALTVLSPLLVAIAIAIKLDSPGPVFFRQARTGRQGHPFSIFKFRTMRVDAETQRAELADRSEVDGPIFKIRDDPRVTRIGSWLRKTSLDELPQLLNVLTGDMSIVGPRPFPVAEAAQIADWTVDRTDVRPGITGLWQTCGRTDLSFSDLRQLDSAYVASWSIWWDLRILLQTPACVLRRSGAY